MLKTRSWQIEPFIISPKNPKNPTKVHYDGDIDIKESDKQLAFQAIDLLKSKILSGELDNYHVDIYTKIQIGLTTKIWDESYG